MDQLPIAVVERETGLSKDTLRVWEKRYGFPAPGRDKSGNRVYGGDDVTKLRLLRQLMDMGYRPARIVAMPLRELEGLAGASRASTAGKATEQSAGVIALLQQSDMPGLRDELAQQMAQLGLVEFVCQVLAPLSELIGNAWSSGEITVAQEHLFSEVVTRLVRSQLQQLPARPTIEQKILFATLPGERHALGLLMAESVAAIKGHPIIPLGTEVPVKDLVWACEFYRCDVVALSFSQGRTAAFVLDGVKAVRQALPPTVELWVGGGGTRCLKAAPSGVRVFGQIREFRDSMNG